MWIVLCSFRAGIYQETCCGPCAGCRIIRDWTGGGAGEQGKVSPGWHYTWLPFLPLFQSHWSLCQWNPQLLAVTVSTWSARADLYSPFSRGSSQKPSYFVSSKDQHESVREHSHFKNTTPEQPLHCGRTCERKRKSCPGDGIRREGFIFRLWLRAQHLDVCWCPPECGRPFLLSWGLRGLLPYLAGLAWSWAGGWCWVFTMARSSAPYLSRWWNRFTEVRWHSCRGPAPLVPGSWNSTVSRRPQQTPWGAHGTPRTGGSHQLVFYIRHLLAFPASRGCADVWCQESAEP